MQLGKHNNHWCWHDDDSRARLRFYGKPTDGQESDLLHGLAAEGVQAAWLRQRHTALVLEAASPGEIGTADGVLTRTPGLALRIATADCVPVLLVSTHAVAAVHAGWRGLVAGVIGATLDRWPDDQPPRAIIGPAIGGCCYEVGEDVAEQVARASSGSVVVDGRTDRPHLELQQAARLQLERWGVAQTTCIEACTMCQEEQLWSYRREGPGAGRNIALVWLEAET